LIDVGQNFQFHGSCLRLNVAIGITRGLIDEIPKFRLFPRCKVSSHNHGLLTQIRQIPFVIYDIVVGLGFALHLAIEHLAPLTEKSVERNQTGFSAFPSLLRPRSQAVKRDPAIPMIPPIIAPARAADISGLEMIEHIGPFSFGERSRKH
jgi:hypothetical protein